MNKYAAVYYNLLLILFSQRNNYFFVRFHIYKIIELMTLHVVVNIHRVNRGV